MTYSATNFADDVFNDLARVGAIIQSEASDPNLDDNSGLQASYAMTAIWRFDTLRQAAEEHVSLINRGLPLDHPDVQRSFAALRVSLTNFEPARSDD